MATEGAMAREAVAREAWRALRKQARARVVMQTRVAEDQQITSEMVAGIPASGASEPGHVAIVVVRVSSLGFEQVMFRRYCNGTDVRAHVSAFLSLS